MQKILIVEDEEIMRISLEDSLKADGYEVESYEQGADGIEAFNNKKFSLVISDVRLPDITGIDILESIKRVDNTVPVIIMTAFGTIEDAVSAMKLGAFDYITKPFSLEDFMSFVKKALDVKEHRDVSIRLKKELPECQGYASIIGESDEMKRVFDLIERVSQTDSTILILGENGTGKELVASTIHCQSKRKNRPLIKINCAAIPENLIESELFGYEKGAFTGAAQRKPGRFDLADKGSIFLDEIGDLPASIQVKLLRVLQDGSFERLGGTETINVDVKVIAATNRNLEEDVKKGRFREDLFYRLNVIPVQIPSLRERKYDIPLLINHFTEYYNDSFDKKATLKPDVVNILMDYDFPGNVRELENIIERCLALSINDEISVHELPPHIIKTQENQSDVITLSKVAAGAERQHIMKILKTTKGNKTKAADILGINRKTLWEKLKAYKIEYK
jgi:two-component system response regulator AtoC